MNLKCNCFFCLADLEHTDTHKNWGYRGTWLKLGKDESLNPDDRFAVESCRTCGHTRVKED
jgi:hypothetical protein